MKVEFTIDLINKIVKAATNAATLLLTDPEATVIESVEGVDLSVKGNKINLTGLGSGLGPAENTIVTIYYGEVMLVNGIGLNALLNITGPHNPLYFVLIAAFGPQTSMVNMDDVVRLIHQNSIINAIDSHKETIALNVSMLTPSMLDGDFSVKLPGNVVFTHTETSLLVKKGENEVFNLITTHSYIVNQFINIAASVALSVTDPIEIPARVVDTSVKSYLFNTVLYQKTDGGEVSFVFDDERTRLTIAPQRQLPYQYSSMINTNQQFFPSGTSSNIQPERPIY